MGWDGRKEKSIMLRRCALLLSRDLRECEEWLKLQCALRGWDMCTLRHVEFGEELGC